MSLFERIAKSAEARSLLMKCGESLQLSDDALIDLKKKNISKSTSCAMCMEMYVVLLSTCCVHRRGVVRRRNQQCACLQMTIVNFLAYIHRHPEVRDYPSTVGYGWTLVNGRCRSVRHTHQALPPELHTPSSLQAGDGSSVDESESEVSDLPHSEPDLSNLKA